VRIASAIKGRKPSTKCQDADLTVGLGYVLSAIDRVVGIGRVIYRCRILWPVARPFSYIVTF